jgi:hypothetical protein
MAEPQDTPQTDEQALTRELAAIRVELARLNAHRFVRQMNSPAWMLGATFLRGLALGLGTAVGATILVSLVAYLLAQVDFIPIIGAWAARIADHIQLGN